MHTNLKNTLQMNDLTTQYDDAAKKLLAQKIILAHILKRILEDFKEMDPKEIVPYIEGGANDWCRSGGSRIDQYQTIR